MCKCNPSCRTPFCGKPGCQWPEQGSVSNVIGQNAVVNAALQKPMPNTLKLQMLLKQKTTKTLVTGDKSVRVVLETVNPGDVLRLTSLEDAIIITVEFIKD